MKKALVLAILFLMPAMAVADELDNFSGMYKAELRGLFNTDTIEFLVNTAGETKIINYEGDEELGMPEMNMDVSSVTDTLGPDTLPIATITFWIGSDEETHAFIYRLAIEWDGGDPVVKLVDTLYTINDGPNSVTTIERSNSSLSRWDKGLKEYVLLEGI